MIQEKSLSDFIVPPNQPDPDQECEEPLPQAVLGGSLKNLEQYLIKGDLRRCVICNASYEDMDSNGNGGNLPRVLYCGDCICETCIVKQIQKASITEK
jgi:hypothetical protein